VVAQLALLAGMEVQVLLHGNPDSIQGDALIAYQEMIAVGTTTNAFSEKSYYSSRCFGGRPFWDRIRPTD
jgi:NAD(P)H-hydrate repair Nnr-like enzyme with NAD(P)H-hydrate epimerase domain